MFWRPQLSHIVQHSCSARSAGYDGLPMLISVPAMLSAGSRMPPCSAVPAFIEYPPDTVGQNLGSGVVLVYPGKVSVRSTPPTVTVFVYVPGAAGAVLLRTYMMPVWPGPHCHLW